MIKKRAALIVLVCVLVGLGDVDAAVPGQDPTASHGNSPEDRVFGPSYAVPETHLYLTDEETGEPIADVDVLVEYSWGWTVIRGDGVHEVGSTVLEKTATQVRATSEGLVVIPKREVTPSRPVAPDGVEYSAPEFRFVEVEVVDARHNSGLFFDAKEIEQGGAGDLSFIYRTVGVYRRRHLPPRQPN
jgi:hypothetical protein